MNRKKTKNMTIMTGKWPLIYTGVVLAIGIAVTLGILYVLTTTEDITSEMQVAMAAAVALVIIALVVCFSILRIRAEAIALQRDYRALMESYDKTSELNNTLREQRHDFLNHIQIIHGLIEMDNHKEAAEYMEDIYSEIQAVNNIMKTKSPAINALLQVKGTSCAGKNINFRILSTTRLEKPVMETWDICGILGNLIDNAIHAAEKVEKGKILVSLKEDIKNYIFKVKDNGTGIPKTIVEKVFDMGFTTKGNDGSGVGLAVSKRKLKENGGDIKFTTSKKGTVFTFTVPKEI
ncbi:MAG: Spo0B domain-containing protein [Clostridiales bacterium]|nr:Spo0B domain-containing protein [Clostridiales bacterium]